MKKLKLFFAALALLVGGANSASAVDWTDKTSVITNPSFETDKEISDLTTCGWGTDRVTGWTITPSSPGNAQVGVGNSSSTIQGIASSFSPSAGDKYFYMRENWNPNTTFSISQTIADGNIPAGIYRLTVKAAMFSSVASTYTLSLQEEGQTAATNSFSYAGTANSESWKDWSVMLIKQADGTDLTITAAYKTPSENSGGKHYCLLLDDVKLEYIAPTSVSSTNTFDMTSWIVNPSFELNTFNGTQADGSSIGEAGGTINKPTGYTCYFNVEGWKDCNSNTTAPADGTYCMNSWFGNIKEQKFYQTIAYLPEGVYEISAQVRTDQTSTDGIYTYGIAGGETFKSASWDASKMAGTWNSMENWQTLTARASVIGGGSLQFGLRSDKFIQFDDFHLTYLGSDLLLSELKSSFSTKQTTATALLGNSDYDNVVGTERTTLNTKKSVTPEETVAGWTTAVNELQAAIDAFTAAKTNYDLLATEITKATALGMDASSYAATSSSTAASALTNTQNLKVAEYTYVTTNYVYSVDLGAWTTTGYTSDNSGQHWDGTGSSTYKEQENSWGDPKKGYAADAWTIKFEQTISLPAGNYVFKVAGRKATGNNTVMSLDVTNMSDEVALGSVNDFPEGDTGLGINTSGATDFTTGEGHTYANGGAGRGWEWRYVKFTIPETKDVKIAVNAVATATSQWMSFCNYTLQTDDEANIALITYNIALANAQTIIADGQYSNVTGSEKTALQAAIDADASLDKTDVDAIEAATTTLSDATTAFTGAKSNYDAYVAAKAVEYPTLAYATTAKRTALDNAQAAADATSASDADTKKAAIQTAARQYYESHALAEGVDGAENKTTLITDPNFAGVTISEQTAGGWTFDQTGGSAQILSGESFTDGSGSSSYSYFDYYNNGANNQNIHQVISDLAPGRYMLTATARAHSNFSDNIQLYVTDKGSVNIPAIGNSGGVFNRGWNDASVEFYQTTTSDVTIGAKATGSKKEWWGVTRFRLVRLGDAKVSGTITPAGWASFSSSYPLDLNTISGGTAYYASESDESTVTLTTTTATVPAGEGIMIKGTAGDTFTIDIAAEDGPAISGNLLKGQTTTGNVAASTGDTKHYVFGYSKTDSSEFGFYNLAEATTVPAGKAYLEITTGGSGARALRISLGSITEVENVEAAPVATVKKNGAYLENGKIAIYKNGMKFSATGAKLK